MKKMISRWKQKFLMVMLLFSLCLIWGCREQHAIEGVPNAGYPENNKENDKACLEIHFIDVGQGDCTLLINGEHAMLIDGGDNYQGTKVQKYLKEQGIKRLEYVIGTHPDADHIGGLDVVLTKFDCGTIMLPDTGSDTMTYRQLLETVQCKRYQVLSPKPLETFVLGEASFTVIAPVTVYEEGSNNNSIGLKVTFGENEFLFIGDAEKEAQYDILESGANIKGDVLKAGHHGSSDSADRTFWEEVGAEYTVISCGKGNDYGHPHERTLKLLKELGVKAFRTDEQGTIVAVSNGEEITWNCIPSESWTPGVYKESSEETINGADYILNTNSFKFHRPECESVLDMWKRNKKESNLTREEIIELGYVPCNRCKP